MKYFKALPLFLILSLTLTAQTQSENSTSNHNTYIIKNVNIISMTVNNKVIENGDVVIQNQKIQSINGTLPDKAIIIDGKGKWLIPGLIDMHVHNLADINLGPDYPTKTATHYTDTQDFMFLYIANGVTTVFELSARPEHFAQRNEIQIGKVIGPRIALAMLIDGGDSGNTANTPEEGRQTVRIAKAQGYEFIKVYSHLNIETFRAILEEANKLQMKVIGHIPDAFKGKINEAFIPNFDMIAHAEELAKQTDNYSIEDAQRFAELAKDNGTWLTPTLTVIERMAEQSTSLDSVQYLKSFRFVHPLMQSKWLTSNKNWKNRSPEYTAYLKKIAEYNKVLVQEFKSAGVPIVAGTDAGSSGVVWGFSLHDELELLVEAGLTTEEVLASATVLPATWLGIADKIGTIETGKFADLLLLDENPIEDIRNTRKIYGVFADGRWYEKRKINRTLERIAKHNSEKLGKDKYDWSKRRDF